MISAVKPAPPDARVVAGDKETICNRCGRDVPGLLSPTGLVAYCTGCITPEECLHSAFVTLRLVADALLTHACEVDMDNELRMREWARMLEKAHGTLLLREAVLDW